MTEKSRKGGKACVWGTKPPWSKFYIHTWLSTSQHANKILLASLCFYFPICKIKKKWSFFGFLWGWNKRKWKCLEFLLAHNQSYCSSEEQRCTSSFPRNAHFRIYWKKVQGLNRCIRFCQEASPPRSSCPSDRHGEEDVCLKLVVYKPVCFLGGPPTLVDLSHWWETAKEFFLTLSPGWAVNSRDTAMFRQQRYGMYPVTYVARYFHLCCWLGIL